MENKEQLYFELQAYWGITKHMGELKATKELIELCHMAEGKYVLDVGCGPGRTPCYIAKRHNSKVVGVDISQGMIASAKERAKREGVEDRVEFRVGDAQDLPFGDNLFNAVICESVMAFIGDKQKAIKEFVRVAKPGGYIGLDECTWIKAPPPEWVEYLSRATGVKEILASGGWKELLEGSGLQDLVVRTYKIRVLDQFINEIRWLGFKDILRAWYRFPFLYIKSSACRKYVKGLWPPPKSIFNIFKYFGYGIYVGRK